MLHSLLAAKDVIIESAGSLKEGEQKSMILDDTNCWCLEGLVEVFDPLSHCISVAERKEGSLGESVKAIFELGRSLFAADWSNPIISGAVKSYLTYIAVTKLEDEFDLLLAAYAMDRRYKLDYLTENAIDSALSYILNIGVKSGLDLMRAKRVLVPEFESYCQFEHEYAAEARKDETAAEWWSKRNDSGRLQQVALRLAYLKSSSANIERTFSALKYIQGSWRMNFCVDKMRDIARIRIDEKDDTTDLVELAGGPNLVEEEEIRPPIITISSNDSEAATRSLSQPDCDENKLQHLDSATRVLYRNFVRYVDFSKITKIPAPVPLADPGPAIHELVSEFRAARNRSSIDRLPLGDATASTRATSVIDVPSTRCTE